MVYVNDLGDSAYGTVGTYSTSGLFCRRPQSERDTCQQSSARGGLQQRRNDNRAQCGNAPGQRRGQACADQRDPSAASSTVLGVPIVVLDTTQFSFFTGTTKPSANNNNVDITPGAGLSTISATSQYTAIGGADINTASNSVDVFAFNSNSLTTPGMLLEYNLAPGAASPETVLSNSTAMPSLYGSLAPWSRLNFNPESTELLLSVGSPNLDRAHWALTSPPAPERLSHSRNSWVRLCLPPRSATRSSIRLPATSMPSSRPRYTSGAKHRKLCRAPVGRMRSTSPPIVISPATLIYGFAGES